ncbi:efflux RND transporter periplasmic adaptor subunit [Winogradskyella sp. DF17]|uniref:Efflux RND transporter periplasmic adaptor subunit n=1 Tax=Winogradskyella pelagia TaxID=2819984 RepID=A0ABS3SZL3_9FLAO|nr:efflux RND transporter periplasmic adaptor subunit [Winogradskyella sp. DF17]MBO3115479.1 efflux RND transporter periplasmic adaptor subunit [Winogradskyella sp. DF17]
MKFQYILLVLTSLALISCGGKETIDASKISVEKVLNSKDLDSIKAKKDELYAAQQEISAQLKQLNDRIALLDENSKLPLITTVISEAEPFYHFIELQGNVTTKSVVTISSEFNGQLTQVFVKEGQKVSKGQVLAKIDDGGLSQQIAQMKIQRDLAKTTFERQKRLWEQNIGSEIQYLQAKSNYEAQSEAISQMNQQLAKTKVTAPISGTIDEIFIEQGNLVAAGLSLMRLVNLNNMYIETDVPERYVADVTKGKTVDIEFPFLGKTMSSTIRQASDYINPSNRTYTIEVPVTEKDSNIKPNLTARLRINDYTNENAILIPQNIISEDAGGSQYVFALKDISNNMGTVERIDIKTGKTQGDIIEVISGLQPNMQLIKEGARSVKNGQRVKIDRQS